MKYDYLIVGSGLFGATFAYFANKAGKKCLVIDKRPQLGGNVYCEKIEVLKKIYDKHKPKSIEDMCMQSVLIGLKNDGIKFD